MEVKVKNKNTNYIKWFKETWKSNPYFSTGIALLVMIVLQTLALGFNYPSFGDWLSSWTQNWINILRNNAGVGIIALGMTFVIISGGIDLAVGSTLVAVGAMLMMLIDVGPNGVLLGLGITGVPAFIIAIIIACIFGTLLGQGTGFLITKGKLPPFIATLGIMKICRSVTQHFMQSYTPKVPQEFLSIASFKIGGQLLMPIIYWIVIAIIMYIISQKTTFGRHVFAIGSNERTAKLSGINVAKVKRWVYSLMGLLVAISAIIQVSRIGSMDYANAGSGYEMDAIAAVIVGGTRMSGGRGSIIGTVFGMLIIAVMNNLLNLIGVPPFLREACKGAIVIGAVLLQKKEAE
ncbi:ABC transporter permease [Clostridium sp. NSJ-145]|uniref:ABC transporter permease n=1 Tax=Clostridium sp. NSJ-145 TaxID=2897777 RepID=UPI001E5B70D9|nr:ABC transporter permease [Clostridium sp. NSJ-145]MCD2502810.1 ABC transporter permease [Clostridium sp. NSJ-145]